MTKGKNSCKIISEGDSVRIRNGRVWEPAVVTHIHDPTRSFIVTIQNDQEYCRIRRHILATQKDRPPIICRQWHNLFRIGGTAKRTTHPVKCANSTTFEHTPRNTRSSSP